MTYKCPSIAVALQEDRELMKPLPLMIVYPRPTGDALAAPPQTAAEMVRALLIPGQQSTGANAEVGAGSSTAIPAAAVSAPPSAGGIAADNGGGGGGTPPSLCRTSGPCATGVW